MEVGADTVTNRLLPNGDFANAGAWTGPSPLFTAVDEDPSSDADFVTSPSNPTSAMTLELSLSDPEFSLEPVRGTNDSTLRIRARATGGKSAHLTYNLLNGAGTVKVSQTAPPPTSSFVETDTIASSNAWSTGEFTDARVQLVPSVSGGGSPTTIDVSWFAFDVPDPAPPPAPTGLVATPGDTTVHLTWDNYSFDDRTGYFVRQDGVEHFRFASWGSFQDIAGLTNGTAYNFEVGFYGPGGDGPTASVMVTPVAAGPSPQTVTATGIASAQAIGTATLTTGPVTVSPSGISSAQAVGSPTVTAPPPAQTVTPSGVASAEAVGSPTIAAGPVTVSATGIASAQAMGSPTVTTAVTVSPTGIASAEAFGSPTRTSRVTVTLTGIPSAEATGSPTITTGPVTASPTGVASAETFGTAIVSVAGGP